MMLERRHAELLAFANEQLEEVPLDGAPLDVLHTLATRDLLRACVPDAYGGLRPSIEVRDLVVLRLTIASLSPLADTMFAMQGLGSYPLTLAGNEVQKRAHLPGAADGTLCWGFAITEPEAGSDVGSMTTTARRDGDHYVVHGEKCFISNAGIADRYTLFARTSDDKKRGISAFILDGKSAGLTTEPMKLLGDHPVGRLILKDVQLPVGSRLGEEGDGLQLALRTLDFFRTTVGAAAVGMAQRALDEAISRVKTRVQFGKTLAQHQATQLALADMALDVQAARLLCFDAAQSIDEAENADEARFVAYKAAMAKLFATEAAQRVVDRALQLWGGAGLVEGMMVEKLYREVRALRIYEGTSEIQKLVIARALLSH